MADRSAISPFLGGNVLFQLFQCYVLRDSSSFKEKERKKESVRPSGQGQVLGAYVANWVLVIRLVVIRRSSLVSTLYASPHECCNELGPLFEVG